MSQYSLHWLATPSVYMIHYVNINDAKIAPKSGSKSKLVEATEWSKHFQTSTQLNWSKWSVKTESTLAIDLHFLREITY